MNVDPLLSLILSLPIGVASGWYSSLIVTKLARFSALRGECLRIVRGLNFIGDAKRILVGGTDNLSQMPLVAGEMLYLGHKEAGTAASALYSSILGANLAAEYGKISVEEYGNHFLKWQEQVRELEPSRRQIFWPFSKL